jgi:hypothetical protein
MHARPRLGSEGLFHVLFDMVAPLALNAELLKPLRRRVVAVVRWHEGPLPPGRTSIQLPAGFAAYGLILHMMFGRHAVRRYGPFPAPPSHHRCFCTTVCAPE